MLCFSRKNRFCPAAEKKSQGAKKERRITVSREHEGKKMAFEVVDSVARFRSSDWYVIIILVDSSLISSRNNMNLRPDHIPRERVVAVVVSGQTWQFKDWKMDFPVEVFSKVMGVFVFMKGGEVPTCVDSWNVRQLEVRCSTQNIISHHIYKILFVFRFMKVNAIWIDLLHVNFGTFFSLF